MAKKKKRAGKKRSNRWGPKLRNQERENVQCEIEMQLERQRRKRTLSNATPDEKPTPRSAIGSFRYDPNRRAYFPSEHNVEIPTNQDIGTQKVHCIDQLGQLFGPIPGLFENTLRAGVLRHALELSTSSRQRALLRSHWIERQLTSESRCLSTSQLTTRCGWVSMLPQFLHGSSRKPWDLECKERLHPSTQTFDIQNAKDGRFPSVLTDVDQSIFLRLGIKQPKPWTERRYLSDEWHILTRSLDGFYSGRFAPTDDPQVTHAMAICSRDSKSIGHIQTTSTGLMLDSISAGESPLNDFTLSPGFGRGEGKAFSDWRSYCRIPKLMSPQAIVAFAPAISQYTKSCSLFKDIHSTQSFGVQVGTFPRSDVLCVEFAGKDPQQALFGHRNGAISLVDKRCQEVRHIAHSSQEQGSVTSIIAALGRDFSTSPGGPHGFIAKKALGSCFLYDVRKAGRKNEAQIFTCSPPENGVRQTLSACCSGVAVDPTGTVAIAPYIDANNMATFAFWSLRTGRCVGTKTPDLPHTAVKHSLHHCELNRTFTSAWKLSAIPGGQVSVERDRHRWSLWFKLGSLSSNVPSYLGSIHQISFSGNPETLNGTTETETP